MTGPEPEPIDEDAARRATAVVTLTISGNLSAARQLIAEDPDIEGTWCALAQIVTGLVAGHARHAGAPPAEYWQLVAIRQEAAMAWWRDHGPTL